MLRIAPEISTANLPLPDFSLPSTVNDINLDSYVTLAKLKQTLVTGIPKGITIGDDAFGGLPDAEKLKAVATEVRDESGAEKLFNIDGIESSDVVNALEATLALDPEPGQFTLLTRGQRLKDPMLLTDPEFARRLVARANDEMSAPSGEAPKIRKYSGSPNELGRAAMSLTGFTFVGSNSIPKPEPSVPRYIPNSGKKSPRKSETILQDIRFDPKAYLSQIWLENSVDDKRRILDNPAGTVRPNSDKE